MADFSSPRPITQADIAAACGVSKVTVSKALRDDPKISQATRERVKATAKKLGYKPDTRLSELMSHMANRFRRTAPDEVIGYLHNNLDYEKRPGHYRFMQTAAAHAEQLGYKISPFYLHERDGYSNKRLAQVLHSRGIRGLILSPINLSAEASVPALPWEEFASVGFGQSLPELKVPRFDWNYRRAVRHLVHRLHDYGYRRIGIIVSHEYDRNINHPIEAEAHLHYHHTSAKDRVLPLISDDIKEDAKATKVIPQWAKRQRPEVFICSMPNYARIRRLGLLPPDTAYACWSLDYEHMIKDNLAWKRTHERGEPDFDAWKKHLADYPDISGMVPNEDALAEQVVSQLVSRLYHRQLGLPEETSLTLIEQKWHEGETAPPKR